MRMDIVNRIFMKSAIMTMWEAFPSDDPEHWMPTNEARGPDIQLNTPDSYDSVRELLYDISQRLHCPDLNSIDRWSIQISGGIVLMTTDYLVDYNGNQAETEKVAKWKNNRAQLYHGYVSIEMRVLRVEKLPDDKIFAMFGKGN